MSEPIAESTEVAPIEQSAPQVENTAPVDAAPVAEQPTISVDDALAAESAAADREFFASLNDDELVEHLVSGPASPPANEDGELESLRQQLAESQSQIAALHQQVEAQLAAAQAEVQRRLDREIDSWASPTLGVGRSRTRTLKQTEAAAAFRARVHQLVNAVAQSGGAIPTIEEVARTLRPFADPAYRPGAAKSADRTPLGSPGTNRDAKGGGEQPRSIHHALAQNPN